MTKNGQEHAEEAALPTWREQAVARSLDSARTRAENRVQRFLDAATELLAAGNGKDFTVQEVVERSGQSLRSFYQYFGGKHELLLALFEEAIRSTNQTLATKVEAAGEDPIDRLHAFVVEYYRLCQAPRRKTTKTGVPAPVLVDFALQLLTDHPTEASRAFTPLVAQFAELLEEAVASGKLRSDIDQGQVTGSVLQAVMFSTFAEVIVGKGRAKGSADPAEAFWDVIFSGLSA